MTPQKANTIHAQCLRALRDGSTVPWGIQMMIAARNAVRTPRIYVLCSSCYGQPRIALGPVSDRLLMTLFVRGLQPRE